jgi:hypothetical protein
MAERIRGPRAVVGIRARAVAVGTAKADQDLRAYFRGLRRRYMAAFRRAKGAESLFHVKQGAVLHDVKAGPTFNWSAEKEALRKVLNAQYAAMTEVVWSDVTRLQVGRAIAFDLNSRGVQRILGKVGTRVTQINRASQEMIANRVAAEINRGSNADKLESSLDDLLRSWGESGGRAHIIALTETGFAYNYAAIEGYRESGIVEKVQVYDGPDCGWTEHDDPDLADGSIRTLEEAEAYPLSHPHCQRAFGPVALTDEDTPTGYQPTEPTPAPEPIAEPEAAPAGEPVRVADPETVIQEQGERIRTLQDHEVGIAVDRNGNVIIDKTGYGQNTRSYGGVNFTDQELAAMRGETLIHNHPGGYIEGWPRAGAFSPDDILLAHEYGIGEMRVVGKRVDYIARAPQEIDRIQLRLAIRDAEASVRKANEAWIAEQKAVARATSVRADGGFDMIAYGQAEKAIYAEASMDHYHKVWEEVARAIPQFRYHRVLHDRG